MCDGQEKSEVVKQAEAAAQLVTELVSAARTWANAKARMDTCELNEPLACISCATDGSCPAWDASEAAEVALLEVAKKLVT